jgi:hypothetical protein
MSYNLKFILIFTFLFNSSPLQATEITTNWNTQNNIKKLFESNYNNDFFQLSSYYQPQINPLYCGIASSVIILNAFRSEQKLIPSNKTFEVLKPKAFGGGLVEFKSYSQLNFLNKATDVVKNKNIINLENINDSKNNLDPGLTLKQLSDVIATYQLDSKIYYAKNRKYLIQKFRNNLKKSLSDKTSFVIANFHGKTIGKKTNGHISPIAAYDEKSDMLLVMDVASHKNIWFWVKLENFYSAMNVKDGKKHRGYLVVTDASAQ